MQKGRFYEKTYLFVISDSKYNRTRLFSASPFPFRVIARPQGGRGNLKVEGMGSRNEAQRKSHCDMKMVGFS